MPDNLTETESIPPVRVAEFPPGQLALQSPEGWIYQRIDGKDVYPNANQQPVSNYYDVHRPVPDNPERRYILWPDGKVIAVADLPVWEWDGTSLAAKHFRPVPTSEPVAESPEAPEAPPPIERQPPVSVHHVVLSGDVRDVITDASRSLQRIADALEASVQLAHQDHRRIATALEGILADLTKGNDADKA